MNGHEHDIAGTLGVALVSAGVGLVTYMGQSEVAQAALVAGLCGLVGGIMKGVGSHLWKQARLRWVKRKRA